MPSDSNPLPLDEFELYSKEKLARGLEAFVRENALEAKFQPIFDFNTGEVIAFEGLGPIELTRAAKVTASVLEGEYLSRQIVLAAYAKRGLVGKVFLNVSLDVLLQSEVKTGETLKYLAESGLSPSEVVIKLSKIESALEDQLLKQAIEHYRAMGFQIALCNLNQGFTGLGAWASLKPDYVQLDQAFIVNIHQDKVKLEIARSIYEVALHAGAKVIAEGVGAHSDLMALRDIGIQFGQGNYLAEPAVSPIQSLQQEVIKSILRTELPRENLLQSRATVTKLLTYVLPVSPSTTNAEVFARFESNPEVYAIPVVQDGNPLGLINRNSMIDHYARPFPRELLGDKYCETMMDDNAIIVDYQMSVQELSELILNSDPRHLSSGFMVVEAGLYVGMGNGHDLLRLISSMQINAARYANPLTLLPGNIPICDQMDLLIQAKASFVVCYFDLDNFKPYNDMYGFQKGDEVIQLTAKLLSKACGSYDFIGHVGGDDFIVLFQSADWENRCQDFLSDIALSVPHLYSEEDRLRGGIEAEDRKGIKQFYPLLTMSIASVKVTPGIFNSHHQISEACTSAKKQAKKSPGNSLFIERRLPSIPVPIKQDELLH